MRRRGFHRRLSAKEHWDLHYGPNMTPMVDVVMVILVFFMASTAVMGPEWMLKSALPVKASAAQPPGARDPKRLEIAITLSAQGRSVINGPGIKDGDLDALQRNLAEQAKGTDPENLALLVTPAPDIPYADIVRIHEICHGLGITKIGLLEAPPPKSPVTTGR